MSDITLRDVFINNLPENVASMLLLNLPDTFKKARDKAFQIDNAYSYKSKIGLNNQRQRSNQNQHGAKGQKGTTSKPPKELNINPKPIVCNHCGKKGHKSDKCFKLHGYPNKNDNDHMDIDVVSQNLKLNNM